MGVEEEPPPPPQLAKVNPIVKIIKL
jgi:hypothetical protein